MTEPPARRVYLAHTCRPPVLLLLLAPPGPTPLARDVLTTSGATRCNDREGGEGLEEKLGVVEMTWGKPDWAI